MMNKQMIWLVALGVSLSAGAPSPLLASGDPPTLPPNDLCPAAVSIGGEGKFAFDNTSATADGPTHETCSAGGAAEIDNDVWFCWTSPCDGIVAADTCGGTTVDTKLAVYEGCGCPPTEESLLGCNDDACLYQSRATFTATAGQSYLVRLGTHPGLGGGTGTFSVTCGNTTPPKCDQSNDPFTYCRQPNQQNALNSTRGQYLVADEFGVWEAGTISQLRWWGGYSDGVGDCQLVGATSFEVRYYANECDQPGELIAGPFSQADGTLEVAPPARTCETLAGLVSENVYDATHADVPVLEDEVLWLEISNSASESCAWYWATGGTLAMQDGRGSGVPDGYDPTDVVRAGVAFCIDVHAAPSYSCIPSPVNDECVDALPIHEGDTFFSTRGSTTDGPEEPACGFLLGDDQIHYDIWYDYVAPCSGVLTVETCDADFDTKVAVYEQATCPPQRAPVACNDDACGPDLSLQSVVSVPVAAGQRYAVRIGGYGTGTINLGYTARPPISTNLSDYANLTACYTGACSSPPCDPPLYSSLCCQSRDYDHDGDVDLNDFAAIHEVLTGP